MGVRSRRNWLAYLAMQSGQTGKIAIAEHSSPEAGYEITGARHIPQRSILAAFSSGEPDTCGVRATDATRAYKIGARTMIKLGYKLMSEEHGPIDLVRNTVRAEQ